MGFGKKAGRIVARTRQQASVFHGTVGKVNNMLAASAPYHVREYPATDRADSWRPCRSVATRLAMADWQHVAQISGAIAGQILHDRGVGRLGRPTPEARLAIP